MAAAEVPVSLNDNTSPNDSIGAFMTQYAETNPREISFGEQLSRDITETMALTLDIDTSPATTAKRVNQEKRRLLAEQTPVYRVQY